MLPEENGRGLLLHATIVNTIYVPGVRQDVRGGGNKAQASEQPTGEQRTGDQIKNARVGSSLPNEAQTRKGGGNSRGGRDEGHGRHRARLTFDARDIISKYKDYEWMRHVRIEKVAICRMGAKKRGGNGEEEYEIEAEVEVPWA